MVQSAPKVRDFTEARLLAGRVMKLIKQKWVSAEQPPGFIAGLKLVIPDLEKPVTEIVTLNASALQSAAVKRVLQNQRNDLEVIAFCEGQLIVASLSGVVSVKYYLAVTGLTEGSYPLSDALKTAANDYLMAGCPS
jgi:hypothetical protein